MFDFGVVGDVCGAKLVESLFECAVVVVFMVCDVVQPSGGDCVEHEEAVFVCEVLEEVSEEDVCGHFRDCLHVRVSVRLASACTCCLNEFREYVPALFDGDGGGGGGGGDGCHCCCLMFA